MTVTLVTPQSVLFQGEVAKITLPAVPGELTILPGHTDMLAILTNGEIIIDEHHSYAVSEGFVNVNNDQVHILVSRASDTKDLDEEIIKSAISTAKQQIENRVNNDSLKEHYSSLKRSISDLKIVQKRKRRQQSS